MNGNLLAFLSAPATSTGVNHFHGLIKITECENVLQFDGAGISDSYGITVSNVKLYTATDSTNLITNGDFSQPS